MAAPNRHLGVGSGIGLVAGSMIGAGVFVSAGYMAQDLSAGWILLAWVLGAAIAGFGAIAYGELARIIPRSGGEYRYLTELVHPLAGALAGWSSLIFGFSAPLAINALGAAAFASTLFETGSAERFIAAGFVAVPALAHAVENRTSRWVQNGLAICKLLLVVAFAVIGVALGESAWPDWSPPKSGGFALGPFVTGLFFVGFAYSGWNSSVYAASEFKNPKRDVPRSMLLGLGLVFVLYMIVNWVFVTNLTPAESGVVAPGKPVTLGHLVAVNIVGDVGGKVMSVVIILAFLSAISAITVIGPRVYAEMAEDGALPRALRYSADGDRPPARAVMFQTVVAIALLTSHSLREVLINASAILLLFTALSAVGLIRYSASATLRDGAPRPPSYVTVAAIIYVAASTFMLGYGFREHPSMLLWIAGAFGLTIGSYAMRAAAHGGRSRGA